jgi:toxin ParE1/3/4
VRLVVSHAARADLAAIVRYIALDNPRAARSVRRAIAAAALRLKTFPRSGRLGHREGTRELIVPDVPFMLVYEVTDDTLVVLAVLHGARDMPRVLDARDSAEEP